MRFLALALVSLTATEVIARIQKTFPAELRANTVDTFKAGDPETQVTGVAVTMMATLDVLQRAVKQRANLIITGRTAKARRVCGIRASSWTSRPASIQSV